ncbi:MAG: 3-isopropylmalate dehydrogenase [Microlunatus sp.]|nr:3-isopropylmalate dehydrogenase [Microlunatus sp.]
MDLEHARHGSTHFLVGRVVVDVAVLAAEIGASGTGPAGYDARVTSRNLAVIGGDGIGPEVVAEGVKVLQAVAPGAFELTEYDLGAERWKRTGEVLPDSVLHELAQSDGILFGAVGAAPGDKSMPSGILERGLILKIRFAFDHYVNLRPSRVYPGIPTPLADSVTAGREIDFVVVREGTEGLYVGNGGVVRAGTPAEIATEVSINTAYGVERVVRDAFARAARRRGKITLVHKHNVLVHAGGLWRRIFETVAAEYPGVSTDYLHVDAATIFLATDPARFDVIVTDNLFGDIITDLAGAVTGGIGLAASGNINPEGAFPSMFEPVHGSAPDIAGLGIADPTATILSVGLLLDHLGRTEDAARVEKAVLADIGRRSTGQPRSTAEIGDAIASAL